VKPNECSIPKSLIHINKENKIEIKQINKNNKEEEKRTNE